MANLMETISALNSISDIKVFQGNSLCIVTSNDVFIGTQITVNNSDAVYTDTSNLIKHIYYLSLQSSDERRRNGEFINLDKTILLANVKYKVGRVIMEANHIVLNIAQVVSLHVLPTETAEEFLQHL
ncbi:hypothetical protein MHB44_17760 [Lysinibacillus sp. FSL H8-0500]|uniref:hypothetical protein n=1 Tax=Lysinibacillus sp. FSL H8-0500 TaxID=2921393 RepID=UPI0031016BF1